MNLTISTEQPITNPRPRILVSAPDRRYLLVNTLVSACHAESHAETTSRLPRSTLTAAGIQSMPQPAPLTQAVKASRSSWARNGI